MAAPPGRYVFDPFAEGFIEDPYPHYARLRTLDPAQEHPLGFWVLSTYEGVSKLLSSGHSVDESRLLNVPLSKDPSTLGKQARPLQGLSVLDQDPPDHPRLRRLMAKALAPRSVDALSSRIQELVDALCDRIAELGHADLVAELAFPLPFAVVSEMLGAPPVDQARLRDLSGILLRTLEPLPDPLLREQVRSANEELMAIGRDMVERKRAAPADDLLTALITAEHEGDLHGESELVAQVMFLYLAGHETTVNLISNGLLALLRNPDQLRLFSRRPDIAANAVDELLRYDSPAQLARRVTTEAFAVHGKEIPAGSFVTACLSAANRDPEFWGPDADTLRLDRPSAHRHLSFGGGAHSCLGARLARLEGRIALSRLVKHFPSLSLDRVSWNGRINLRGPDELWIDAA
ncbi:cytochrome [Actinomadura sp. CNU-125]|uniref:cytochrome P450 n=1 Tax=Actinomadura sp. CNU-125 TaxID=1904961 RepID=UPI00095B54B1|nr:cytochrome P450 [Actinomadura sp. CNU-125]OLT20850.1 cytochrome [Actinomadura sp. CNU-125]